MRMRKLIKYMARFLGAVLVLALAAALLAPYLVDPAEHLDGALQEVTAATGLVIEPQGRMRLSLLPWVGLDTGPLAVTPNGAREPLATLENARVRLEYAPLFSGELVVHSIHIKGLTLNLAEDAPWTAFPAVQGAESGRDTSEEPGQAAGSDQATASGQDSAVALTITDGLLLTNSRILYADQDGSLVELRLDRLELGPMDLTQARNAAHLDLEGRVLAMRAGWDSSIELGVLLVLDAAQGQVQAQDLDLDLAVAGPDLPGLRANLRLVGELDYDVAARRLDWQNLLLLAPATRLSSNGTLDLSADLPSATARLSLASVPRDLLHSLGLDAGLAPELLTDFSLDCGAAFDGQRLDITDAAGRLDRTAFTAAADARFSPEPALSLYLAADSLDLDPYLVPDKAAEPGGPDLTPLASLAGMRMEALVEVEELVLGGEVFRQVRWTLVPEDEIPQGEILREDVPPSETDQP